MSTPRDLVLSVDQVMKSIAELEKINVNPQNETEAGASKESVAVAEYQKFVDKVFQVVNTCAALVVEHQLVNYNEILNRLKILCIFNKRWNRWISKKDDCYDESMARFYIECIKRELKPLPELMSKWCQKVLDEKDSVTGNSNAARENESCSTDHLSLTSSSKLRNLKRRQFLELQKLEREHLLGKHKMEMEVLIAKQRVKDLQEFSQLERRQLEQLHSFERQQLIEESQDLKKYKEGKLKSSSMPAPKRRKLDTMETKTNDLAPESSSCNQVSSSHQQTNVDNESI